MSFSLSPEAKIVSIVGVLTALLLGGVTYFAVNSPDDSKSTGKLATPATLSDAGQLTRPDSITKGDEQAKVTVVEFGDFQCPACRAAAPFVAEVIENYKGKGVQFVFRHFPLPMHDNAQIAANAAEAAQGKFWEMHDLLFSKQDEWTAEMPARKSERQAIEQFIGYAKTLGLDESQFAAFVKSRSANEKIARDLADGNALDVDATPTFFVNGAKLKGADDLVEAIEKALAQ